MKKKELKAQLNIYQRLYNKTREQRDEYEEEVLELQSEVECLKEREAEITTVLAEVINQVEKLNEYNNLINVKFEDKTTTLTFQDGTEIKSTCAKGERFSKEMGIALCLAKHWLKDNVSLSDLVYDFSDEKKAKDKKFKSMASIYRKLKSPIRLERVKAQEIWNSFDERDRQSVKDRIKNED